MVSIALGMKTAGEGRPDLFLFRILDHPMDAWEGKPRGKREMLDNINALGLYDGESKWILVSDKWTGTLAAVKQYRQDNELTGATFPHDNHVDAKWSFLKR